MTTAQAVNPDAVYDAYVAEMAPFELAYEQEMRRREYADDADDTLAEIQRAMAEITDRYREALA